MDQLRPGLTTHEIERLVGPLGVSLPSEAVTWWRWRDGVAASTIDRVSQRTIGGPDFEFLPLAEAVALYRQQRRLATDIVQSSPEFDLNVDAFWHPAWFPISSARYGGIIACDCGVRAGQPTPIRMVIWGDSPDEFDQVRVDSFGGMVAWWLDALDRGAWKYDRAQHRWLLDYGRLEDPSRELTRLV